MLHAESSRPRYFLDAALLRVRAATDSGRRTDLDAVIIALGYDRTELEAELGAEQLSARLRRLPPTDPQRLREDIDATVTAPAWHRPPGGDPVTE